LLGDSKQIMEFNLGYSKELGARGAHPAERIIAHNAAQLAVLADWLALLTKSTMMRLYDYEHILTHLLYNADQPIRGKRIKEVQALLGDHGVRLHLMEETFEEYQERMAAEIGDLHNRFTFKDKLEGETKKK
jgi:hypothetical protein